MTLVPKTGVLPFLHRFFYYTTRNASWYHKLATRYWRVCLEEMYRDFSKAAFLKALQRYLPDLRTGDLLPGPSGVRAQALAPDGTVLDDFIVNGQGGVLHVRNAPSPAATSSLAIAEMIANSAAKQFRIA